MILYHFTSLYHLPVIQQDGVLHTTESNVSIYRPQDGPDVVWLIDEPLLSANHGLMPMMTGKGSVRFEMEVHDAVRWMEWPPAVFMDVDWRNIMIDSGGGREAAEHWWINQSDIPRSQWRSISLMDPDGRRVIQDVQLV